ncbi:hypothetical protein IQ230_13820 [Gloeocapsopsis crepidinum LEGE 06123]|uniref:Uncharacterized protein n=1 Tax=Gloeocapsopsis crepidinum LEGE 06123 TaxID=588587 RepID=A0ABR9UT10_9CHRO|nr:hypothetical protein [Gloeocapsopsis crepidinum]MBE9191404.1 hypothetical protein [Gloeocapsopsis crepidinum LEGE 06123]
MDLKESMLLWIPVGQESQDENNDLIQKVTQANGAVLDFCDGIISLDETFQIAEYYGADVDDYREILDTNFRYLGA